MGEPPQSGFAPTDMEAHITNCVLAVIEHPTAEDLCVRYCEGRTDGLRPYTLERFIVARRLAGDCALPKALLGAAQVSEASIWF